MIILSGRHRNKYSLNHSSLSYIIRRFDFQAKGLKAERERERERERESERETYRVRLLAETVLQYSTLMLSSRRDHSILCGFSNRSLF